MSDQTCQLHRIIRRLLWLVIIVVAVRLARRLRDEWPASFAPASDTPWDMTAGRERNGE